jgi:hypothetical protein
MITANWTSNANDFLAEFTLLYDYVHSPQTAATRNL